MRISLGSDHRGVSLVQSFVAQLRGAGHDPVVLGECSGAPCDYPDIAWLVANSVARGEADRGMLDMCGFDASGPEIIRSFVAGEL